MSLTRPAHAGGGAQLAPKVLAAAADGVVETIERCHGNVDAIFGRAAINAKSLESPFNELSLRQYCGLFEEAAAQTGNDNFGLNFGSDFVPKRLGAIGYVAINSPTLSVGLRNFIRYFSAHQDSTTLSVMRQQDLLWLNYQILDPHIEKRRHDAELSLGMFRNLFRHCLGEGWAPVEVRFEHAAPDDPEAHRKIFNAPVRFGQRTNSLVFWRHDLNALMPDHDPYLFAVIAAFLSQRRQLREKPDDFVASMRQHIKLNLGDNQPTLEGTAKNLGLSKWALQCQLKQHNVSFTDMVKAARRELALRYVCETDTNLTEIALALGYSELSAFSRAFRNLTGMSPQKYRDQHHNPR